MTVRMLTGHCLDVLATLEPESVHLCVTSPPYFNLRDYKLPPQTWPDGWVGSLGAEPTVDRFVAHLVAVFAAVRRVLRRDGTLWVVIGDSYARNPGKGVKFEGGNGAIKDRQAIERNRGPAIPDGLKEKDLLLVPDRFRIAMQSDGWYVRSKLPWVKRAAMPESCRDRPTSAVEDVILFTRSPTYFWDAESVRRTWADDRMGSPGGKKPRERNVGGRTDGLTRPGQDWTAPDGSTGRNFRNADLFYDSLAPDPAEPERAADKDTAVESRMNPKDAARVEMGLMSRATTTHQPGWRKATRGQQSWTAGAASGVGSPQRDNPGGGLADEVGAGPSFPPLGLILDEAGDPLALDVNPEPFKGAHFACFPPKLVRPLILAGTSEKGCCPGCGAPWVRRMVKIGDVPYTDRYGRPISRVTQDAYKRDGRDNRDRVSLVAGVPTALGASAYETTGWQPSCSCPDPGPPIPCTVLDCFSGAGTTLLVSDQLGRDAIGIDLNDSYSLMGAARVTDDGPLFAKVDRS